MRHRNATGCAQEWPAVALAAAPRVTHALMMQHDGDAACNMCPRDAAKNADRALSMQPFGLHATARPGGMGAGSGVQMRQDRDSPTFGGACPSTVHQGIPGGTVPVAASYPRRHDGTVVGVACPTPTPVKVGTRRIPSFVVKMKRAARLRFCLLTTGVSERRIHAYMTNIAVWSLSP